MAFVMAYKRPRSSRLVWVISHHTTERDAARAGDQLVADAVQSGAPRLRGRGIWRRYAGPLPMNHTIPTRCLVGIVAPE